MCFLGSCPPCQHALFCHSGSAESWAARAALWAQQRHVEQQYAQQYQQPIIPPQQPQPPLPQQQHAYPPLPPENAPPLPEENAPPAPDLPGEPLEPPGEPPLPHPPDLHPPGEGEPEPPGNGQLYPPGEDPGPELRKEPTLDNIEVAPMEEDDSSQSELPNIQPGDAHIDSHYPGNQSNDHDGNYGNLAPNDQFHGQPHGGQFEHHPPLPFHETQQFDPMYQQHHGGFPPEQYPNGQFSNYEHGDQQLYPSEMNDYNQYNYNEQRQYGNFEQYDQGRQPEYHQLPPKPLLQAEIPMASLPAHVVADTGECVVNTLGSST